MGKENQQRVSFFRKNYSLYQQNRDLINVGAYQTGSDAEIDRAIQLQPELLKFLAQDMNQAVSLAESYTQLEQMMNRQMTNKASRPAPAAQPATSANG